LKNKKTAERKNKDVFLVFKIIRNKIEEVTLYSENSKIFVKHLLKRIGEKK